VNDPAVKAPNVAIPKLAKQAQQQVPAFFDKTLFEGLLLLLL
jgi:hypothetical protein